MTRMFAALSGYVLSKYSTYVTLLDYLLAILSIEYSIPLSIT